jgi:hypothetical protein
MKKPRICLNMIVKNEAHVIKECLDTIIHLIDYYVIVDTGSTDDTIKIMKDYFNKHNIKGEFFIHEFRTCKCHGPEYKKYDYFHFGWNRTYALQKCFNKSDYIFIMDADDVVEGTLKFPKNLTADQYYLKYRTDFNSYLRPQLIKNNGMWEYKDGLHEFLSCIDKDGDTSYSANIITFYLIDNYEINSRRLGDRNKDPNKYKKDIEFLEILIKDRPDYTRYKHYHAQSLYSDNQFEAAIKAYNDYLPFEKFEEAKYLSLMMIARSHLKLNKDENAIRSSLELCFKLYPEYAEPMYELCKYYNSINNSEKAYEYGMNAINIPMPLNKVLPVDKNVYYYKLLDELIWSASETKRYKEAIEWSNQLLKSDKIDKQQREIVQENLKVFYKLINTIILDAKSIISKIYKKIIGFYLGPSILDNSIFGSEIAVINLAKEFNNNNKQVIIFADTIKTIYTKDNIIYMPSNVLIDWNYQKIELMIVSRYIKYFIEIDVKLIAKKTIMWLHDIDIHPYYNGFHLPNKAYALVKNVDKNIDNYICSSPWHRSHLIDFYKLDEQKVKVIGLGSNNIQLNKQKVKNRYIWVSDYNRGLDDFVTTFMIIRALNKTAELHIYRELPNELKSKYEKLDYIKLKGYVENNKILEAMSEAEYFVYITEFQETFCLSVLEAQLMGCLCITSNTAALETTNQGIVLENNNRETLIQKLNNITDKENIIKKSINWALNQTWKNKMKEWNLLY